MGRFLTLANFLTLIRFIVSPIMLPFLVVYLLPFNELWINGILAALFVLFSLTDFFDGYFARKFKQVSTFGRILDPIADKILVYSVLIALLAINKIYFVWVLILIGRDFFMMGIRQVALEQGFTIPVTFVAKIKTAVQLFFLTILILNPYHSLKDSGFAGWIADFWREPRWMTIEWLLLAATIILALSTAWSYYRSFIKRFLNQYTSKKIIPTQEDLEV